MGAVKRVRALRRDRSAVSPVIATILMVAITVVLAAVLYVMVSGLLPPIGGTKPVLSFGFASLNSGNATIEVAGASPPAGVSPSNYRVNLEVGGTPGTAIAMPTTSGSFVSLTISGTTLRIYWTDIGGGGTINQGDQFRVTGNNVPLPGAGSFVLHLLWSDGSTVAQRAWTTS